MSAPDLPHVGVGWRFPPSWTDSGVATSEGDPEGHLNEALAITLRTLLGSRVMRPEFGAGVDRHVFAERTRQTLLRVESDVRRALLLAEPRVLVDRVEAVEAGLADDRIDVLIEYRADRHRRPTSLVLPFYREGDA